SAVHSQRIEIAFRLLENRPVARLIRCQHEPGLQCVELRREFSNILRTRLPELSLIKASRSLHIDDTRLLCIKKGCARDCERYSCGANEFPHAPSPILNGCGTLDRDCFVLLKQTASAVLSHLRPRI